MAGNHKGGGIQNLLLAHCEKAVAVGIVGLAGYLVWASMGVRKLDRTQTELQQLVSTTGAAYDQSRWANVPEEDKAIAPPVASPRFINDPIFAELLVSTGRGTSRPPLPPVVDREDPKLLAAVDLQGTGVTGIFAFVDEEVENQRRILEEQQREQQELEREQAREQGNDQFRTTPTGSDRDDRDKQGRKRRPIPSRRVAEVGVSTRGDERMELRSVACVVAKAPVLEQLQLYQTTLQDSRGYSEADDSPQYVGLIAERAEVHGDSEEEELEWKPVRFGSLARGARRLAGLDDTRHTEMIDDWVPWRESIVDSRYVHPILTMQLPPLVKQDWGVETIHRDAPTQAETDAQPQEDDLEDEAEEEQETGLFEGRDPRTARSPRQRGGFGARGGGGRGAPRRFTGSEEDFDEYSEGGYAGGGGGGVSRRGGASSRSAESYQIDPDVPFAMIRFWDFDVQPGRQYRYRIRLALADVNDPGPEDARGVQDALSPAVTTRVRAKRRAGTPLTTDWSEPSSIISVPLVGDAFVASAKPAGRNAYSEGSIGLLVQSYTLERNEEAPTIPQAIKAAIQEEFRRGDVLNLVEDAEFVAPDGRYIVEYDDFPFRTGLTVVDFRGGEELPGRMKKPVRALMMDASGKLIVRSESEDAEAVQNHAETYAESEATGGFGGGRGAYTGEEYFEE